MLNSILSALSKTSPSSIMGVLKGVKKTDLILHGGAIGLAVLGAKNVEPHQRAGYVAKEVVANQLFLRHGFLAGSAFQLGMAMPQIAQGVVTGLRQGVAARTMLSVPFSHQDIPMQQASQAIQLAQRSMGAAYGSMNEASLYAARYLRR